MPTRRFIGDESFDFDYRPDTYWPELPTEDTVVARVKGTVRRDVARQLLAEPDPTAPDGIGDFLLSPDLGERTKSAWGRVDPRNLGGEFLPDEAPGEVEIARVELASVAGDVCQVRACRGADGRIHYRVVDEYWDEGVTYVVSPESSDAPLTLDELIALIDSSDSTGDTYPGGLVDSHLHYLIDEGGWIESPAELASFATVTSAFYPMLNAYYAARSGAWLEEVEGELEAEREEEEDELLDDYHAQLDRLTERSRWWDPGDELPEDLVARAELLLVEGHLGLAERICDELDEDADDLRVMIAIRRGDIPEAIRVALRIAGAR